jgi:hypothetical protein
MDVLLDALGYQARQPHQEDVSTSSTDAHKELLADIHQARRCINIQRADPPFGAGMPSSADGPATVQIRAICAPPPHPTRLTNALSCVFNSGT